MDIFIFKWIESRYMKLFVSIHKIYYTDIWDVCQRHIFHLKKENAVKVNFHIYGIADDIDRDLTEQDVLVWVINIVLIFNQQTERNLSGSLS